MSWLRVDDGFWKHPKVQDVELAPIGLHVLALSYCADNLTDGRVPDGWVRRQVMGDTAIPEALVDAGLWDHDDDGYSVHDYLDYNPSRAEVEAKRDVARERMRKVRGSRSREVRANGTRTSPSPTPTPTPEASPPGETATSASPPLPPSTKTSFAEPGEEVLDGTVVDEASEAIRLATLFRDTMVARWRRAGYKREARVGPAWATDMRLLVEKDGATVRQVEYVIAWLDGPTEGGQFWAENVQSPKKLRQKWATIVARIQREGEGRGGRTDRFSRREQRRAERAAVAGDGDDL